MAVRARVAVLRERMDALRRECAHLAAWRGLQYDAIRGLIDAQHLFVALHLELIAAVRRGSDAQLRIRLEALELTAAIDALRALIRRVEDQIAPRPG